MGVEGVIEQQFRKSVDSVERRADFVAHGVDEGRFHLFALRGAAALAGYLLVGVGELPPDLFQPSDHDVLVDAPADEQQQQHPAGKQGDEFHAVGQPGFFKFQLSHFEQGLHLGEAVLRLFHAVVVADRIGFAQRFEGVFVVAQMLVKPRLHCVYGGEIRFCAVALVDGYGRVDIGHGPLVFLHVLVIAGAGAVNLGQIASGAGQLHALPVILGRLLFGDKLAQIEHLRVGAHRVARRVAVGAFEAVVHRQPCAVQVDTLLDLLFGAFVFAEHVEFGKLVAADPLHVETLFQRISFEFFQCLLHIGDRLADVVVGFGRQRREV